MKKSVDKVKMIAVRNAEGKQKTVAEIVAQNKIDYEPKVSVIIPVYNVEKYLRACLDSVVGQTLREIEIICVDDGSTDSSLDILKEYAEKDKRITVMRQQNKGQGGARNQGICLARGKYIQFLDSDDFYALTCCEEMYKIMEEHSDVDVGCYGTNIVYETFENLRESDDKTFRMKWQGKKKVTPQMILALSVNCWDKIFRKSFVDAKHLRFPEYIRVSEDFCFFWSWMTKVKYIYFYMPKLINYRRREGSSIDSVLRHHSEHLKESFQTDKLIYDDLIVNNNWDKYKTLYMKAMMSRISWKIACFPVTDWQGKREIIDKYALFLSRFAASDFDLEEKEMKIYRLLTNRNYFAFDAYDNHEIDEAYPAYSKDSVNLVFSTDKNYISYLAVTIESIIENSSAHKNYDIIILYQDVYDYQKRFLLSLAKGYQNVTIRLLNMSEYIQKYELDKLFTVNHITLSAYFRLFIGKIFAKYEKILYLDCDLVVTKDIAELFYQDIGEYPIAAALDTAVSNNLESKGFSVDAWKSFRNYMKDTFGFFDVKHYFNSGVMIVDIAKFNENQIDYLIDIAQRNNRFFHDQNVMNVVFEDNYYLLPQTWNLQWHIKFLFANFKEKIAADVVDLYENINKLPAIIHYTSHEKPWKNPHHTFADIWWGYAKNTPFYEIFINELHKGQAIIPSVKNCTEVNGGKNDVSQICCAEKTIENYKLFGFIPLFKVKKRGGAVKYYLFGLPLVKIENK